MSQLIDPIPSDHSNPILCCYVNATSKIQVARITNIPNWYFERVVFPGQHLVFEAVRDAVLEIHTGMMASAILSDSIPCHRLKTHETVVASMALPLSQPDADATQEIKLEVVQPPIEVSTPIDIPTAKVS